jgi:glycosyltransferase involved in cell wall biosynthesis
MVTSLPSAYPYRSDKLHVIGQGIDTEVFKPGCGTLEKRLILCVGRLSRVKDHATLLRATLILQRETPGSFEVNVVGGAARPEDAAYSSDLMAEVQREGLEGTVKFIGPVARAELPAWYCRAAVHVNLTPKGFGDKVALEAMACETPCLTANTDLRATLGAHADTLLFAPGDSAELASKLRRVLTLPEGARLAMGRDLREHVVALHGLDRLAGRILEIGLAGRGGASAAASN